MTDPDPTESDRDPPGAIRDPPGTDRDPTDPGRIRSIAVHREDVASALEATLRTDREVVLRVTPPFSGRMRARLHSVDATETEDSTSNPAAGSPTDPEPVRVDPRDLVENVSGYPEVDRTAAEHPDADVETRRRLHEETVDAWRERVRDSIVESVALDVGDGAVREVDVHALG